MSYFHTHGNPSPINDSTNALLAQSGGALMDCAQASAYLGVSNSYLRKSVLKRTIPFFRLGTRTLFRRAELDSWINSHFVPTGAEVEARAESIAATAMLPRARSRARKDAQ